MSNRPEFDRAVSDRLSAFFDRPAPTAAPTEDQRVANVRRATIEALGEASRLATLAEQAEATARWTRADAEQAARHAHTWQSKLHGLDPTTPKPPAAPTTPTPTAVAWCLLVWTQGSGSVSVEGVGFDPEAVVQMGCQWVEDLREEQDSPFATSTDEAMPPTSESTALADCIWTTGYSTARWVGRVWDDCSDLVGLVAVVPSEVVR